jgi:transposase
MRFYTTQHAFYCGVDLHARTMYVCVLDQAGKIRFHRNLPCRADAFLRAIEPFREDLVVGVECLFCWYWVADLCAAESIEFVLGHAYYMKAIHGGKSKNDKIDSHKIAALLRGGTFPLAYVYPRGMRATRDLLRRRLHFVHKRAELLAHIQNTSTQYNLAPLEKGIAAAANRHDLLEHFGDHEPVQMSVAADLALLDTYDQTIHELELFLRHAVRTDDGSSYHLLRTVPGIGNILALTIVYEIHTIERFAGAGNFLSYARLVKGDRGSAGKKSKPGGAKMGNVHLKWAFSEAAALFQIANPKGQKLLARLRKKHGRGKAMGVLAAKLGRAVYFVLKRKEPFDLNRFVAA